MKNSTTNNPIPSAWCANGSVITTSSGFFTPATTVVTSTGGAFSGFDTNTIYLGDCRLEQIDNELYWVRPDGSKTCLTGKGANFDNLYDKLNNP